MRRVYGYKDGEEERDLRTEGSEEGYKIAREERRRKEGE